MDGPNRASVSRSHGSPLDIRFRSRRELTNCLFLEPVQPTVLTMIEQTSSQLFLITQSTGILAVILHQLDYQFRGSQIIGIIVWLLTIALLVLFVILYIAKAFLFPKTTKQEITSNIIELCTLASIPITFGTIIEMVALVCAHTWGEGWGIAAYVLAWVNVGLGFLTCVGIPYIYLWYICPGVDGIPPVVVLPAIAIITAASSCGVVTFAGEISSRLQVPMIIVGYILLGLGLPFALSLIVIFMARLFNGGWPPRAKAPLTFVLVGPLGQGAYAFQILGTSAAAPGLGAFGTYNKGRFITNNDGKIIEAVSILTGLVLWGYGAFWLLFSLVESVHLGLFRGGGIKNRGYGLQMWSPVFPCV